MRYYFLIIICLVALSCGDILEEDISSEKIELIIPRNNETLTGTTHEFHWEETEGVDFYTIKIASPSFESASKLIEEKDLTETSTSIFTEQGTYEWFVLGENSAYEASSDTFSFTVLSDSINDLSSKSINIIKPEKSYTSTDSVVDFCWHPVSNSFFYLIQIASPDFSNLSNIISDEKTTAENISIILPEGTFQWRIRAENNSSVTPYYTEELLIDYTSPNSPTLISPRNNAEISLPVLIKWNSEQDIEYDSIEIFTDTTQAPRITNSVTQQEYLFQDSLVTNYYWRVMSIDQAGNYSNFTPFSTFKSN